MDIEKSRKRWLIFGGAAAGIVNGLLGSGGGMIAVPTLRRAGLDTNKAHSGSVAVMLPIAVISASVYILGGRADISQALPYFPGGIVGAVAGSLLLRRISPVYLKGLFGLFAVYAGARILFG